MEGKSKIILTGQGPGGEKARTPSPRATISYASPGDPWLKRLVIGGVEYATGRRRLERYYNEVKDLDPPSTQIWALMLEKLGIRPEFDPARLARVPTEGPVIFIANHPFGVVDGLVLGHLVSQVRPQFFMLVNEVLCREPLLAPFFLPVDFRETREATAINIRTRQLAAQRLTGGEAMAIFPSGGVATAPKPWLPPQDLEWKRFVVRLIQQTRATIIPLYFHGHNSFLFQLASYLSMNLRLGLLLHEVSNKIGRPVRIRIGDPVSFDAIAHLKDRQQLLDHLRGVTFSLAGDPITP